MKPSGMMKKILLTVMCLVLALSLAGCVGASSTAVSATDLVLPTEAEVSEGEEQPTELEEIDADEYEDNLEGLEEYLKACYVIAGEPKIMSHEAIGAVAGHKFTVNYQKNRLEVELYEFDLDNLNAAAKECLRSVEEDGYFMMLDQKVEAYINGSGKYIMIYSGNDNAEPLKLQKARAMAVFAVFHAEG